MHIENLRDYCLAKRGVTEEMPFGPATLVFKVGGKIFLLTNLDTVIDLRMNLKCDPAYALELRETYMDTVIPGYHMNKKHWNTVYANRELSDDFLYTMIDESYALVYRSLPKSIQDKLVSSLFLS